MNLDFEQVFDGSFSVAFPTQTLPWVLNVLNTRTPTTSKNNPWFMEIWEKEKSCWNSTKNCSMIEDEPLKERHSHSLIQTLVDAANTYLFALDSLVRKHCPEMFGSPHLIKQCVSGEKLLEHIKNTRFKGTEWNVSFDESGDVEGSYIIQQYHSARSKKRTVVARWNKLSDAIEMYPDEIDWSCFKIHNDSKGEFQKALANRTAPHDDDSRIPDSVCSYPCRPRHYKLQREVKCCWDCLECRNNEIINEEKDGCEKCPNLMWPDDETATVCVPIEPRYEPLTVNNFCDVVNEIYQLVIIAFLIYPN